MDNLILSARIKKICKDKSITVKQVLTSCEVSKTFIYDIEKRGQTPSVATIAKIADYLGCSVDYLLGRTDTPNNINSHNNISGNNNIIGNGNITDGKLTEQESTLLELFRKLDVMKQAKLLVFASELEK